MFTAFELNRRNNQLGANTAKKVGVNKIMINYNNNK